MNFAPVSSIVPNTTSGLIVVQQDNFDTVTCADLGSAFAMAQMSEDGELHDVIIGREQGEVVLKALREFLA